MRSRRLLKRDSSDSSDSDASGTTASAGEASSQRTDHLQLVVVGLLVMLALVGALIAWLLLGSSSAASASSSANDPAIAGQRDKGFVTSYMTAPTAKHCKARTSTSLHAAVNETTYSTPKTTTVRSASASTDSPGTTTTPIASSSSAASTAATSTGTAKPDVASAGKPCKKGIGYNNVDFANGLANVCWAYNWAPSPGGQLDSGIQYWPMLWGEKSVSGWNAAAEAAISAGATVVLGFNEPDLKEQASMTTDEAVALWKKEIEPLKRDGLALVSPAVTNGVKSDSGAPMGVPWLKEFIAKCSGCSIDGVALHWYDSASHVDYFTSYLQEAHDSLKLPIYLTEFMGTGSAADQKAFLDKVEPWLEQQDFIAHYAAFGAFSDSPVANFFNADGGLTALGQSY